MTFNPICMVFGHRRQHLDASLYTLFRARPDDEWEWRETDGKIIVCARCGKYLGYETAEPGEYDLCTVRLKRVTVVTGK